MTPLDPSIRKALESAVVKAREEAEKAARAALTVLGVEQEGAPKALSADDRSLRIALRAKLRQLGSVNLLIQDCAYEQWHRMLFARFLAENQLLIHDGVPVTLDECAELAESIPGSDRWDVAGGFAKQMLPGIFREDDPSVRLRLAPEGRQALEQILEGLPSSVFTSDDALGWVYQFWQTKKKDEVNKRGNKIGGADLAPVTQLFTEHYMVAFLLENSLGAWWAARHPDSPLLNEFIYLRFTDVGEPAAGRFEGWPTSVSEVTVIDPCCGSGHFLVTAFEMLRKMRMEEESLGEVEAGDAVIRDNLFGLELDPRCTQIAAFAMALAAWKAGGYRTLPLPNIACSGIPIAGQLSDWKKLAEGDEKLEAALGRLYVLFKDAPDLGSLINPTRAALRDDLYSVDFEEVAPLLESALAKEGDDPALAVFGAAAAGTARAAGFLSRTYTLVATNVPYLARNKHAACLASFIDDSYRDGKADLATAFLLRLGEFVGHAGALAGVFPQNWLFLSGYSKLRTRLLKEISFLAIVRLGAGAFETIGGEVLQAILTIADRRSPQPQHVTASLDLSPIKEPSAKAIALVDNSFEWLPQAGHLKNPDARIMLVPSRTGSLLSEFASGFAGIQSGDYPRFGRCFWEIVHPNEEWRFQQSTVSMTCDWGGREHCFYWQDGKGEFYRFVAERLGAMGTGAWIRGTDFAGLRGVAVSSMGSLPVTLYSGDLFDNNTAVILPVNQVHLPAIWHFCKSPEFSRLVRNLDAKLNVTNATLVKVPFDLDHWQKVADEAGPAPEPYSNDPTQWLFKGHPKDSTQPLHVSVARLLGYKWPDQEQDGLESFADEDGIVCLPAVAGEPLAVNRLRALLASAYGASWSNDLLTQLLTSAGASTSDLAVWLRDEFFKSHCKLFHNRPFIWHIWDGKKDGFSALVNYHFLNRAKLDKLIYTHLGWWINTQQAEAKAGKSGAEPRLAAAQALKHKLEQIREGESPYDIYVRWKDIAEQPIGWEPDLNDGVRMNIRPFMTANVLRSSPNIKWGKDRGKEPDGSERPNDIHKTLAEKRAAQG